MKYITDNMLNGLAEALPKSDIPCETAVYAIRKDNDSSKTMKDAEIFRFLLAKKYELRERLQDEDDKVKLITADKDLIRYCEEFGLPCRYVSEPEKRDFDVIVRELVREFS
jgi:hypothetical protein